MKRRLQTKVVEDPTLAELEAPLTEDHDATAAVALSQQEQVPKKAAQE